MQFLLVIFVSEHFTMSQHKQQELIDGIKKKGMEETMLKFSKNIDRTAMLKQLDRSQDGEHRHQDNGLDERVERARKQERHELLAQNIDRHNRLNIRDETKRKIIRLNSQELRELEHKLRTAYVGQGIRAQLNQREAAKLQERVNNFSYLCVDSMLIFEIASYL